MEALSLFTLQKNMYGWVIIRNSEINIPLLLLLSVVSFLARLQRDFSPVWFGLIKQFSVEF